MNQYIAVLALCMPLVGYPQSVENMVCTPPIAAQVMKGNYDPSAFAASIPISDHATILCDLRTAISPDSLRAHLEGLTSFHTRHAFSDTLSPDTGIGAARRWAFAKFQAFSSANEGRLIPAYLSFDYTGDPCGVDGFGWRDVLAVLPGADTSTSSIILMEAHMDSRCADPCDNTCLAPGAEDNGSGSALVIELARVMSRWTFDHTIVFMLTTGEEQGLVGAEAMAQWCVDEGVAIKGVQNNDVVGGIWCGATASDPGCEVENEADSLRVRLFSNGSPPRPHRGFARSIKLWYEEKLRNKVPVPMTISVMGLEDRVNRGGDHIPFRQRFFRNVRFTASHEHGDGDPEDTTYHDRQHTDTDIIGVDTDGDLAIDSFFVDFNYLARNAVINGMSAALLALGPEPPAFELLDEPDGLRVAITPESGVSAYRVGVRLTNANLDFDQLYRTTDTSFVVPGQVAGTQRWVSVASIDAEGITSPFSGELVRTSDIDTPPGTVDDLSYGLSCGSIAVPEAARVEKLPPVITFKPNPFAMYTELSVQLPATAAWGRAQLLVRDALGREVAIVALRTGPGRNTFVYRHTAGAGLFHFSLVAEDRVLASGRAMVVR